MSALLLAESIVTLLPAPREGTTRESIERATTNVPTYLRFMESWRWSTPLWRAGLISGRLGDQDPWDAVRRVSGRIEAEPALEPLRGLMKPELFEDDQLHLEAVSRDVLRAGPDPGITVPVAAGLDALASAHGGTVMRSDATSVVQRAELALGRRVMTVAVPMLTQGSAECYLRARVILEDVLGPLREAMGALGEGKVDVAAEVEIAAREYAVAFEECREELLELDDDDDARAVEGAVSLMGVMLPADAVLTSSLSALRALRGIASRGPSPSRETAVESRALAAGRSVFTLVVRVLGKRR